MNSVEEKNNFRRNNRYNGNRNTNTGNYNRNRDMECFECGEMGHIRPYCPNGGNRNNNRTTYGNNNRNNNQRNYGNTQREERNTDNRNRRTNNRNNEHAINMFDSSLNFSRTTFEEEDVLDTDYSSDGNEREIYMTTRSGRKVNSESQKERSMKQQNGLQRARETRRANTICGTCGTKGHFATECQNQACGKCADLGKGIMTDHLTKNCKYLTEGEKLWFTKKKGNKAKSLVEKSGEGNLGDFNMAKYIGNLPCGLTINQVMDLSPKYTKEFYNAVRKSKEHNEKMNVNLLDTGEERFTPTKCLANIEGHEVDAIMDSGASVCAITNKFLERLGMEIEMPSDVLVTTADGGQHRSLGRIGKVHFSLEGIKTFAKMEVIESKNDEIIIIGTDWLKRNNAILNYEKDMLEIRTGNKKEEIPMEFMIQDNYDSEEEYEDENLREERC
jgi:predicted aspartyl protease